MKKLKFLLFIFLISFSQSAFSVTGKFKFHNLTPLKIEILYKFYGEDPKATNLPTSEGFNRFATLDPGKSSKDIKSSRIFYAPDISEMKVYAYDPTLKKKISAHWIKHSVDIRVGKRTNIYIRLHNGEIQRRYFVDKECPKIEDENKKSDNDYENWHSEDKEEEK